MKRQQTMRRVGSAGPHHITDSRNTRPDRPVSYRLGENPSAEVTEKFECRTDWGNCQGVHESGLAAGSRFIQGPIHRIFSCCVFEQMTNACVNASHDSISRHEAGCITRTEKAARENMRRFSISSVVSAQRLSSLG